MRFLDAADIIDIMLVLPIPIRGIENVLQLLQSVCFYRVHVHRLIMLLPFTPTPSGMDLMSIALN